MKRAIILASISVLCLLQTGWSQVPRTISYQGVLKDDAGNLINDSVNLVFSLYDVATEGTELWSETYLSFTVNNGVFNVILGSSAPLNLDFDAQYWLQIEVDGGPLSPRTPFTSSPYAITAIQAEKADSADVAPWSGITGVPAGFADGVDDTGGAGDGHSLDAADGSPTDAVYVDLTGNVGIGTTTPLEKLTVSGNQPVFMLQHNGVLSGIAGGTTSFGVIKARDSQSTGPQTYIDLAREGVSSDATDLPTTIIFHTTADGSNSALERMRINNTGNVGIGTTNPTAKLHIGGTAGVDGIRFPDGTLQTTAATGGAAGWSLTGNSGTTAGTNFLGTSDDVPLELKVNGARALRLEPNATSPNVIGGHSDNSVTTGVVAATISGGGISGAINQVTADYGTVSGGINNTASGNYATVGGGAHNIASGGGGSSTIGGGWNNTANGSWVTVGGGFQNLASGAAAIVGGGRYNKARGLYSVVSGGGGATAPDSNSALGDYSAVGGGQRNKASGSNATVGGGYANTASGINAFVGGGTGNTASGNATIIGGGQANNASGVGATVSGGSSNTVSAWGATVGGGNANTASGSNATVPGGYNSVALGDYSFAAGRRAKIDALHDGSFLFADQSNFDFNSAAANEFAVRATGGFRFVTAIDGAGNPMTTVELASDGTVTATAFAGDGSGLTNLPGGGDITAVNAGTGLSGGGTTGDVTLSVDVGTTANKIVQLDGTAKLPAVDGSALTSLNATNLASGTVAEAHIDATIARDSEIMPTVLAGDGSGSGVDSDLLDGQQASNFAQSTHNHDAGNITSGTLNDARLEAYIDRTRFNASGYMTALGGIHVGDIADPGPDNLVVDGMVGIGTGPSYALDISGGTNTYLAYINNDYGGVAGTASGLYVKGDALDTGTKNGVGIKSEAYGGSSVGEAYGIMSYASAEGSSIAYAVYANGTGGSTTLREWAFYGIGDGYFSGNVGIGTDSPGNPLEMGSGAHVTTGGTWTDASSREYKEDIATLGLEEAVQTLRGLEPVKFKYKHTRDERHVGFIAEDVPELVATRDRKGLSSMDIAAVLTRVVKEQQREIEALQAAVASLEDLVKVAVGE